MGVHPAVTTGTLGALPDPPPPHAGGVHLLWRCPRRSARWCPRRSAPSGTAREGTGLACARGRWSGRGTLAPGGGGGPCIPRGCRSEGERTGPKRKAEPLCQGQLLLPDYPEKSEVERRRKREWPPDTTSPQALDHSYPDTVRVPTRCQEPEPMHPGSSSSDALRK